VVARVGIEPTTRDLNIQDHSREPRREAGVRISLPGDHHFIEVSARTLTLHPLFIFPPLIVTLSC